MVAFDWDQLSRDFQQKYEKSFIRVTLDDGPEVFWVEKVWAGTPPFITLTNKKRGEIQLNYDTEFEISFEYPSIGCFDYNNQIALVFLRKYARQWKRGISNTTAIVLCPYNNFLKVIHHDPTLDFLNDAFNERRVRPISQAISELDKGKSLSVRLNDCFSLGLDVRKGTNKLLWYLNSLIGEVDHRGIIVREPQFKQEIMDYMRQSGEYLDVIE